MLRIVRVGDYDACACIGAHVKNTAEIGTFKILSHDYEDVRWRLCRHVGLKRRQAETDFAAVQRAGTLCPVRCADVELVGATVCLSIS